VNLFLFRFKERLARHLHVLFYIFRALKIQTTKFLCTSFGCPTRPPVIGWSVGSIGLYLLTPRQFAKLKLRIDCTIFQKQSKSLGHSVLVIKPTRCPNLSNLYDIHHCYVYSAKLLMMDRGTVRNM
jgi:hypothetical protein